jgi:DNA-binding GntR family transcriptional regulator
MFDDASRTRVDEVANALRDRVMAGTYAPGHRLVEAALVAEFAASRGVVREALRRLAAEGVLEVAAHRGAAVRRLARRDLEAITPVREALEGMAARLAAAQGPTARPALEAAIAEQEAAEGAGDPVGAFAAANLGFHALILDLAANPRLAEALRPVTLPLSRLVYARLLERPARRRSMAEHRLIVAALLRGDAEAAEAAMRAHVRSGSAEILRLPDRFLG